MPSRRGNECGPEEDTTAADSLARAGGQSAPGQTASHVWIGYRSSARPYGEEMDLYVAVQVPVGGEGRALLAERIESLISEEHAERVRLRKGLAKLLKDKHAGISGRRESERGEAVWDLY
jgi:hypothetical protein